MLDGTKALQDAWCENCFLLQNNSKKIPKQKFA
jgi:hypothetical protein